MPAESTSSFIESSATSSSDAETPTAATKAAATPTDTDSSSASSSIEPTPTPTETSIPTASVDSTTFQLVSDGVCSDDVAHLLTVLYTVNSDVFNICVTESGYQIFPYTGVVPTAALTAALLANTNCMAFFVAIVRLQMPACEISDLPLMAFSETMLTINTLINNGEPAPDPEDLSAIVAWRRDSNLAKAANVPYDQTSEFFAEFEANLQVALTRYKFITVSSDLTVQISASEAVTAATGSSSGSNTGVTFAAISHSALADIVASVRTSRGIASSSGSSFVEETAVSGSDDLTPLESSASHLFFGTSSSIVMVLVAATWLPLFA